MVKRVVLAALLTLISAVTAPSAVRAQRPVPVWDRMVVYLIRDPYQKSPNGISSHMIRTWGPAQVFTPNDPGAKCFVDAIETVRPGAIVFNPREYYRDFRIGIVLRRNDVEVATLFLNYPYPDRPQDYVFGKWQGAITAFDAKLARTFLKCAGVQPLPSGAPRPQDGFDVTGERFKACKRIGEGPNDWSCKFD